MSAQLFSHSQILIAGVDEVGRGCLFGPVVAAAVVLEKSSIPQLQEIGVKDSKKLSAKRRETLATAIKNRAISYHISYASSQEIDRLNILNASLLAMKRSITKLSITPQLCLIDGNQKVPNLTIPQETIIGGDKSSPLIAAASILAKVWRDQLIVRLAAKYPHYDLENNKGYGTKKHRLALQQYGLCFHHRRSFKLKIDK
ncbi:ribonuclease HII [Crocosphaera chwakensis]|uniref:Ribonuclease HII n=1 Tax=Crocosphaera chwakensis CCY0110 TaxID=391612 RepID=A3IJV4_9CHRO|nr:ribonuclease HII [Crocosphaera chwakensis]EAZ94086.1 Ribonuclease HII/HIII [Crocosphaera chwakensis CCY0110]